MKIRNLIFVIFLFVSQFSFAHKDISIYENYGNVKTYMKTGFKYAEIDKFRVLAKLSDILLKQLNEKDTIFLKYIHN